MSADNGIYIAEFPDGYRVAECGAIENCDDDPAYPDEVTDAYRRLYFGESLVYSSEPEAFIAAGEIEPLIGWTEYGICSVEYNRPFPTISAAEARSSLIAYWDKIQKDNTNSPNY